MKVLKNIRFKFISFVLPSVVLLSVSILFSAAAPEKGLPYKLLVSTQSRLWLEGDSTFHRYESQASVILLDTSGELAPAAKSLKGQELLNSIVLLPNLSRFILSIPVEKMKSGIPGLAGKMHSALKYKKFADIIFTLFDYKVERKADKPNVFTIKATGILNAAGQEKEISLEFEAETTAQFIKITGKNDILMTDFGIKPPRVVLIKAANEVEIKWELYLEAEQPPENK
ncbi:MAG: YceI family protein [Elusimicrobiota bacterium]|nr:YceI family protein [Elusimicrobiota bacterium]